MQNIPSDNNSKLQGMLAIGDAANYVGVSIDTLRRWEKKGRIIPFRSPGGHRYFDKKDLDKLFGVKYSREASEDEVEKKEPEPKPETFTKQVATPQLNQAKSSTTTNGTKSAGSPEIKATFRQTSETEPPPPPPPNYVLSQPTSAPVEKEPVPETSLTKEELTFDQQQKLDNILLSDKKTKRGFDKTKMIIISVVILAILDIILFLIWQQPTSIISPVP